MLIMMNLIKYIISYIVYIIKFDIIEKIYRKYKKKPFIFWKV